MATFRLRVLTVEETVFDGEVDRCIVRTQTGDVGILPYHVRYVAPLGIGSLIVLQDGKKREAAIAGGYIDVSETGTVIFAHTCEWADVIDVNRARERVEQHKTRSDSDSSAKQLKVEEYKLKRSLNRIRVAEK